MEPKMSLIASFIIKTLVICSLFFGLSFLPDQDGHLAIWLYTFAGVATFLIFGSLFLERLKVEGAISFLNFTLLIALGLFVVFLISWTNVFNGPYGDICRWPAFVSSLLLVICVLFCWLGVASYEADRRYEEDDYYSGGIYSVLSPTT